jgi:16S rRNA processing protein RimM
MDFVAIGIITKPIGTHGDVKILSLSTGHNRFLGLKSLWIGHQASDAQEFGIENVRADEEKIVVRLKGVESIERAEDLRKCYVFVPSEESVTLSSGNYFMDDIIGSEVVTGNQMYIGTVRDILSLPANDLWVVSDGKKEILIPAVRAIIRNVDISKKRITIEEIEGLLQ